MLSISTNALRASPRGATARGSPAVAATRAVAPRTCVVLRKKSAAPTTAADASSFFTGGAVGVRSAFKVDRVVAARAPKRATGARADAAVAAAAATSAAPDPGRKFRVLASITGWYFLNAVFAIMNKKTLSCFPYPWILSWIQIAVGAVFMLIMWRLNVFKPPEGGFTKEKMKALVLPSIMHLIAHVSACASYNLASVSFMQVVKAAEPACSVLLLSLFFGKRYTKLVWLTLIPIVGGVMAGSASEVNFSMAAFLLAMTSNVTSALRAVYSKDIQEKGGLRGINLYGGIAIVSAIIQLPLSLIMEGTKLPAAFAAAPALMADKGILLFGAFSVPFIVYLTVGSMFYHLYNQTAYQALAELSPLSHSVANTVKRVVIIIASIAVFRNPISTQGAVAAAIAIAGTCLYSIAQQKAKDDAAKAAAAAA